MQRADVCGFAVCLVLRLARDIRIDGNHTYIHTHTHTHTDFVHFYICLRRFAVPAVIEHQDSLWTL